MIVVSVEFASDCEPELVQQVRHTGWGTVNVAHDSEAVLAGAVKDIALQFGERIVTSQGRITEQLSPHTRQYGKASSLSAKYGLGAFPLHCDTAHWPVPCRHTVLACLEPSAVGTATILLDTARMDLSTKEKSLAASALFAVRNGRRSFYATILSPSRNFVRVDRGCMEPIDEEGAIAQSLYDLQRWEPEIARINWRRGDVLVIDNWRVLHGRDEVRDVMSARTLMRILVR